MSVNKSGANPGKADRVQALLRELEVAVEELASGDVPGRQPGFAEPDRVGTGLPAVRRQQADALGGDDIGAAFIAEVEVLLGENAAVAPAAVRRAARLTVAEEAWERGLGVLLSTRQVMDTLEVSRQHVNKLLHDGRIIGLPNRDGTHVYPVWQFVGRDTAAREQLALTHRTLVEDGRMSPWSAGSWFLGAHPELGGRRPLDLTAGAEWELLHLVARHDASASAQ